MYYGVWSLNPTGNYTDQWAPAQRLKKNPPRSPDTGVGGAADDQSSRRLGQESGSNGVVEGRALDSMDKLHRERIIFKGTDHVTPLIDSGSADQPEPQ